MPNRILREGILTSERVNTLEWDAEVFYRRLMSVVDDFGRYTANPKLLRAALYPLQIEKVRDTNIAQWLDACVESGLVRIYAQSGASGDRCGNPDRAIILDADSSAADARSSRKYTASADRSGGDKRFLEMLDFRQQVRAKDSKYPAPPITCIADASQTHSTCIADAHLDGGGGGDEDEDVDDIPTTPHAREGSSEKFRMPPNWKPSPHLSTLARQAGLPMPESAEFNAALGEFIAYWLAQDRERTQHEWNHALIKSLKADRMRGQATPRAGARTNPRQPKTENFAGIDYGNGGKL